MPSRADSQAGFSLLELIVAIAVLALAVIALLHMGSQATTSAHIARQHTLALIVAQNLQTQAALPAPMAAAGQLELGGQHWHWQRQPVQGPLPGVQGWHWQLSDASGQQLLALTSWQALP